MGIVFAIHRNEVIKKEEVRMPYLAGAVVTDRNTPLPTACLGSRIRVSASKVIMGPGGINKNGVGEVMRGDELLKDTFSHGGAAKIGHTNKEDPDLIERGFGFHKFTSEAISQHYRFVKTPLFC